MRFTIQTAILSLLTLLISCRSIKTKDAEKAYEYWSGSKSLKEVELIKGQYYQSPHFSLEYELFLKMKIDKKWFQKFIQYNNLTIDTVRHDWKRWTELPEWFNPSKGYEVYAKDQTNEFECSRYFMNNDSGICYIYETVNM